MNKTRIIAILALATLFGCSKAGATSDDVQKVTVPENANYVIKTIDGCEYLEYDQGYSNMRVYSLTHKGNCPNHACR